MFHYMTKREILMNLFLKIHFIKSMEIDQSGPPDLNDNFLKSCLFWRSIFKWSDFSAGIIQWRRKYLLSPAGGQREEREPTVDYITLFRLIISLEMGVLLHTVSVWCHCKVRRRHLYLLRLRLIIVSASHIAISTWNKYKQVKRNVPTGSPSVWQSDSNTKFSFLISL